MNEKAEGDVGLLVIQRRERRVGGAWMWESGETEVYNDEGEASCVPADTADNILELSLVPVQSEDNDVCTWGGDCIEFGPVPHWRPNKPSGSLVLVELYNSRGTCITRVKWPNEHTWVWWATIVIMKIILTSTSGLQ
jgi:hypothetical protein